MESELRSKQAWPRPWIFKVLCRELFGYPDKKRDEEGEPASNHWKGAQKIYDKIYEGHYLSECNSQN